MALLKRKRVLAAAIEATAYTAETLDATDATFSVYDPIIQPTIEMIGRPQQGSFNNVADVIGTQMGTCTFRADLNGDGGDSASLLVETFLPACGWYDAGSGVYQPATEVPGTNVKTLTMACYVDGVKRAIRGAVGTFTITLEAGKPAFFNFTFVGAWTGVTDVALLAPTYLTRAPMRFANTALTIGSMTPCVQSVTIDAGNQTIMRPCQSASDGSGYRGGLITNRESTITVNPEMGLVAAQTFQADWLTSFVRTMTIQLSDADDVFYITASVTPQNIQEGDRDGIVTDEITYKVATPTQLQFQTVV